MTPELSQMLESYLAGDCSALAPLYDLLQETEDPRGEQLRCLGVFPPQEPITLADGMVVVDQPVGGRTDPLLRPQCSYQLVETWPDLPVLFCCYPTEARAMAGFYAAVCCVLRGKETPLQSQYAAWWGRGVSVDYTRLNRESTLQKYKLTQPRTKPPTHFQGCDPWTPLAPNDVLFLPSLAYEQELAQQGTTHNVTVDQIAASLGIPKHIVTSTT